MNGTLLTEDNLKGIFGSFDIDKTTDTWTLEIKLLKKEGSCKVKIETNEIINLLNKNKCTEFKDSSLFKKKSYGSTIKSYYEHVIREVDSHPSLKIGPLNSTTVNLSVSPLSNEY